ncbi:MAG: DUF3987 domain-containing protein [Isosphaeraceae bacterium]|nr:DUF3987 domain-containing protein [Isosphaeraceae bacterium]
MAPTSLVDGRVGLTELAAELARREREVVFVTADAGGADALRGWGLLAVARPDDWDGATLKLMTGRDVVVVQHGQAADPARAERDALVLAGVARRVGVLAPGESPQHGTTRNLHEYVRRQRTLGVSSQVLVSEALACLRAQPARVGPVEPEPEFEADWPPLRLGDLPPVEPFPLDVLPEGVARFVRAVAREAGAPVDFPALTALITAGAAIGYSAALRLKADEGVWPLLHALNVAEPSSGAALALKAVTEPLGDVDEGALADGSEKLLAYKLANDPRGLLVARKDATTWLETLCAPRKGRATAYADVWPEAVCSARDGVFTPFLAFCGNLTPEALAAFGTRGRARGGRAMSGVFEYLLFAFPDPALKPHWSDEGIPDAAANAWAGALARLRARRPGIAPGGEPEPQPVALSDGAKAEWVAWYNARSDEVNAPGYDPAERAVEVELRGAVARLALIVHLLHDACDTARRAKDRVPPVDVETLRGALRLGAYFQAQHRRVRWVVAGGAGEPVAGAILDWVRRTGRAHFSVSELTDALRWLPTRPGEPASALRALEQRHAVRRRPDVPRPDGRPGRMHSPTYDVHPGLVTMTTRSRNDPLAGQPRGEISDFSEISEASRQAGPATDCA